MIKMNRFTYFVILFTFFSNPEKFEAIAFLVVFIYQRIIKPDTFRYRALICMGLYSIFSLRICFL